MQGRLTGKKIQNYVFNYTDFLGQGNFSKCYKATNQLNGKQVAIKIVELNSLKSKKLQELLYSQIQILKEVDHPNLLKCHEVFTSNRNCYIITELCDQGDLETQLKKGPALSAKGLVNVIADVYKGLRYLDLKIANVFVHQGASKIADFGFAVHYQGNFKDYNIGSPLYMSPEGFLDNIYGAKTDVWAFGILIYELYHGQTPFHHCRTEAQLRQGVLRPLKPQNFRADMPVDIKETIVTCLQINEQIRPSFHQLINRSSWLQRIVSDRELELSSSASFSQQRGMNELGIRRRHQINNVSSGISFQTAPSRGGSLNHKIRMNSSFEQEGQFKKPVIVNVTSPSPKKKAIMNTSAQNIIHKSEPASKGPIRNNFMQINSPVSIKRVNGISRDRSDSRSRPQWESPGKLNSNLKSPLMLNETVLVQSQSKRRYFIEGRVNFKQSVALLHYCRLLYKHLQCLKELTGLRQQREKSHYAMVGHFLLHCISQMLAEIVQKRVMYQGDQPQLREQKLKEVTEEYHRKYRADLDAQCMQLTEPEGTSFVSVGESCLSILSSLWIQQNSVPQAFICGQLMLVICHSSLTLMECKNNKDYRRMNNYRQIENVLNKTKDDFTFMDFLALRRRLNPSH